jgi:hypothetical protein
LTSSAYFQQNNVSLNYSINLYLIQLLDICLKEHCHDKNQCKKFDTSNYISFELSIMSLNFGMLSQLLNW